MPIFTEMMMKIYKAEEKAGLANKLSNNSISIASALQPLNEKQIAGLIKLRGEDFAKANMDDPHLFPFVAIMATTNWNLNEDVFLPPEVWAARATPINKPLNRNHNQKDIIGHITDAACMTDEFDMLDDDMEEANLPPKFHLISTAVIYKVYRDEEDKEETETLIEDVRAGLWYVSMECNFHGFDYALIDGAGKHMTLPRNEETAFLTAHLKAYGGTGVYNNHRVGRVLRNLVFAGKGLVKVPANPESVIFATDSEAIDFKGLETTLANIQWEQIMAEELETIKAELQAANEKSNSLAEQLAVALSSNETIKAELETTSKALSEVKTELAAMKSKMKKEARTCALMKAGLSEEEAGAKADKFSDLSDEAFDEVIATISVFSKKAEATVEKTETTEEANAEREAEEDTKDEDADLSQASVVEDEELSEVSTALAELLSKNRKQKK